MGFFDRRFGRREARADEERLQTAIERVIEGTDPRIKALGNIRERLAPVAADALASAHTIVSAIPPTIEMSPEFWAANPVLRAMFVAPGDIVRLLAASPGLQKFLRSPAGATIGTIHCVVIATRNERTVFGAAMEGDLLRQDVAQKTIGFNDLHLTGFSPSEAALRSCLEDLVVKGLVLAALRQIGERRERSELLEMNGQLLQTRLRLMEQGGASLDSLFARKSPAGDDIDALRAQFAANEAELQALQPGGRGLDAIVDAVIDAMQQAEALIRPQRVSLHVNALNIVVDADASDAAHLELVEFSSPAAGRSRNVAFLASFAREQVTAQHPDFAALLRTL